MKKLIKLIKSVLKYIFIILITLIYLVLISGSILYYIKRDEIKDINKDISSKIATIDNNTFKRPGPTIIYDKDNKEIIRLSVTDYLYSSYAEIPDLMKFSFIATEDKDFFQNKGISFSGMARAFIVDIKNKGVVSQGGSTITQQLVKNVLLSYEKTIQRKYSEILISLDLTKMYSKEQILEYYINNINYSNGAYSAATASKIYFNKPLQELNLAEITFLTAIPNNPTYYNPLKNYNNVIDRQHLMLYNLRQQNYIDDVQYNAALNTKVVLNYHPHTNPADNYVVSYSIDCATRELMYKNGFRFKYNFSSDDEEKNYDKDYKAKYEEFDRKIREGGYSIYTSFDLNKQAMLQESVDNGLSDFNDVDKKSGLYSMQGAAVCIDNSSGEVTAAVGGRSQKNNNFNRAFLAVRQPGSAIKPILVYGPAFDKGYEPNDIINDQFIPNGPKNAENTFFGPVTIRYATELSLNTVAYQVFTQEGIDYGLSYLYKMNFNHIVKQDRIPIISIGGFTHGATPVEMAGAYSTLARGGSFIEPTCIKKIAKENGDVIYENSHDSEKVYKPESAYNMTDVLKGVLTESYATGYNLGLNNMPSAGKTGTTSESKDGWFAGYTPYMTTVVWVGYDIPTSIESLYGATYPGHIWQNFMNRAHEGLQYKEFELTK